MADSVQTWLSHIRALSEDIGPRGPTTEGERRGAEYCQQQLSALGYAPQVESLQQRPLDLRAAPAGCQRDAVCFRALSPGWSLDGWHRRRPVVAGFRLRPARAELPRQPLALAGLKRLQPERGRHGCAQRRTPARPGLDRSHRYPAHPADLFQHSLAGCL